MQMKPFGAQNPRPVRKRRGGAAFVVDTLRLHFPDMDDDSLWRVYGIATDTRIGEDEAVAEVIATVEVPSFPGVAPSHKERTFQDDEGFFRHLFQECVRVIKLPEDDLIALHNGYVAERDKLEVERNLQLDKRAFFNGVSASDIQSHWRSVSSLTPEEAVALTLGKEPSIVNQKSLAELGDRPSPFRTEFERRLLLVSRAKLSGQLDHFSGTGFNEWAAKAGVHFSIQLDEQQGIEKNPSQNHLRQIEELEAKIERYEIGIDKLTSRSILSLSILTASLIDHMFKDNPDNRKRTANVHSAILRAGRRMDEDTVRDWIWYVYAVVDGNLPDLRQVKPPRAKKVTSPRERATTRR